MAVSRRFNVGLAEAREMIEDAGQSLRDAEMDRLAAWDECNKASALDDAGDSTSPPMGVRPLFIGGSPYAVESIPSGECGTSAVRLMKAGGLTYNVVASVYGTVECDCPDYIFRHEGTGRVCKHGKALIAAGVMPSPRPRKLAPIVGRVCDEFDDAR